MSTGFEIAIRAIPFINLLDEQEEALAAQVLEANDASVAAAMDATRRRLAQGVDTFVRSLPIAVRNDANTSRAAAYALVALADERMLHHPAGGLNRWRERLLEYDLYGSALAGQEIVERARAAAYGTATSADSASGRGAALLAPLYLAIFQVGFEGSLRGDTQALSSLTASLAEAIGSIGDRALGLRRDARPKRVGVAPSQLAAAGLAVWLASGFGLWLVVPSDTLGEAVRIAERVSAGLPVITGAPDPLEHSAGPSGLPQSVPPVETTAHASGRFPRDAESEWPRVDTPAETSPHSSDEPWGGSESQGRR